MKNFHSVIKSPVITEKSMSLAGGGKVAFWVEVTATKTEIKEAVQRAFNVSVVDVNTQRVPGKIKRLGRYAGRKPTRKKAYVTLKEGSKIELFEGV